MISFQLINLYRVRSVKLKLLLIFTFKVLFVETIHAGTITCSLPATDARNSEMNTYIHLVEPRTIFNFDVNEKITRVYSPGCNKLQSIYQWMDGFKIECGSNNSDTINLEVNTAKLEFHKNYVTNGQNYQLLSGFCKRSDS